MRNFKITTLFIFIVSLSASAQNSTLYKFDFGNGKVAKGYTQVKSDMLYNADRGFGFDYNTQPESVVRKGKKVTSDFCTSSKPFYFSVDLPEGNYDVKVILGDTKGTSKTTIKAESRRLFINGCETNEGEMVSKTFTVNVRTPKIDDNTSIRLKKREYGYLNWDNKLTIEFNDSRPCIAAIEITPNTTGSTVFLAGNSTVVDQDKEPWAAWGQMITNFFNPKEIVIANFAESGESLASFKSARRLAKVLSIMKPGDYLFVEFGHNDMKRKGEGIGPWLSYTDLLKEFVTKAREKGGIPVLVTSMHRRSFNEAGEIENTLGDYPAAVRKVAEDMNVTLIDLNNMSKVMYEAWGPQESKKAFVHYPANTWPGQTKKLQDNTHFNSYGAYQIAQCIITGIQKANIDLVKHIKADFTPFDPAEPDAIDEWQLPISPMAGNEKPDGN